jgi:hypothetical protein
MFHELHPKKTTTHNLFKWEMLDEVLKKELIPGSQ